MASLFCHFTRQDFQAAWLKSRPLFPKTSAISCVLFTISVVELPTNWLGRGLSSLSTTFHMHISYTLYSAGTKEIGRQLDNLERSPFSGTKQMSNSAQLLTWDVLPPSQSFDNRTVQFDLDGPRQKTKNRPRHVVPTHCNVGLDKHRNFLEFLEGQFSRRLPTWRAPHSPFPDRSRGLRILHIITTEFPPEVAPTAALILHWMTFSIPERAGQASVDVFQTKQAQSASFLSLTTFILNSATSRFCLITMWRTNDS